jgi:hypothetical protein
LAFWCINYIAAELEMPFGDNPNDLPVEELQVNFNASLRRLMDPVVQAQPNFNFRKEFHERIDTKKMSAVEMFFIEGGKRLKSEKARQQTVDLQDHKASLVESCNSSASIVGPAWNSQVKDPPVPGLKSAADPAAASPDPLKLGVTSSSSPGADVKLQPKMLEAIQEDLQAGASASSSSGPGPLSASLAVRMGVETVSMVQDHFSKEKKKGAPLSMEEWKAFEHELGNLAGSVEERLRVVVQELVQLLVPAACSRLAEAGWLAQGFVHPTKPWAPATESPAALTAPHLSSDPILFDAGDGGNIDPSELTERFQKKDARGQFVTQML